MLSYLKCVFDNNMSTIIILLSRKDSSAQKGSKPDKVALVCFDMEGTYQPDLEL